jgi:predicted RNase H-like HicB family nuclease
MKTPTTTSLRLPFRVKKDGGVFVSCCPTLDVYSQGPTRRKAIDNLVDALRLFLVSCYERKTLDQVLKSRPRTAARNGLGMLTVPLPFLVETERKESCPA